MMVINIAGLVVNLTITFPSREVISYSLGKNESKKNISLLVSYINRLNLVYIFYVI